MMPTPSALHLVVPNCSANMTGNQRFTLSDYREKKVILYFYPKDNTPGCTAESIAFREAYPKLCLHNTAVFGISRDSVRVHEQFKEKFNLPFDLISDPDEILCTLFNVMKIKNMYGKQVRGIERSTFIIDAQGVLMKEWRGVKVLGHVEEVLQFIQTTI